VQVLTVIGVILSALGVILAATGPVRKRVRKRLEYVVVQNQRLLNVPRGVSVEFAVEGRRVDQAFVTVLRIANTGTENFPSRDWETPLVVRLEGCSVISAQQIAARPLGWRVGKPIVRGDSVKIPAFLFNAGDLFELQIVSEGATPNPHVSARLPGLTQVSRRQAVYNLGNGPDGALVRENKIVYWAFGAFWLALTVFVALAPVMFPPDPPTSYWNQVPLLSLVVGVLVLYLGFLRWATVRNQRWRPAERF
jgi:hypothetical protein